MMDYDQLFGMLEPGMDGRYYYVRKHGETSVKMISRSDDLGEQGLTALMLWTPHGLLYLDQEVNDGLEVLALVPTCQELEALDALQAEVARLTKMLEVCSVTHRHNVELKAEVERLKALPTAAQERAAIVAWLREKSKTYHRKAWCELVDILAQYIERGEHGPTEGPKCRHCLRTLRAHEQDFCDACSQLEGRTP